jgi:hypothetical protein
MTVSLLAEIYTYEYIYIYIYTHTHMYLDFYAKVCYTVLVLMLMLITYILYCTFYKDRSSYFCKDKDIWSSLCFRTFIQEINIQSFRSLFQENGNFVAHLALIPFNILTWF